MAVRVNPPACLTPCSSIFVFPLLLLLLLDDDDVCVCVLRTSCFSVLPLLWEFQHNFFSSVIP